MHILSIWYSCIILLSMPPKFDVLQFQNNRKNCIKQLVERIEGEVPSEGHPTERQSHH